MGDTQLKNFAFIGVFAAVTLLLFLVFLPFLTILTLAMVLATLLYRPYRGLLARFGGRRSAAAACMVVVVLFFCIVPLFFLGTEIFLEAQNLYGSGSGTQFVEAIQHTVLHEVQRVFPSFSFTVGQYVGNAFAFVSGALAGLVSGTLYLALDTFLMLLAFFFFLRDGDKLLQSWVSISPFGRFETEELGRHLQLTIEAVVRGTLLVALIRWVLVGVAFYLFGIPDALLWGSLGGIVGAIPGLGTLLVFVPAVLYLYLKGSMLHAVALGVFGLMVITLVDNLLTPYFFGKGLEVPQIIILFSVLGGIIFFGPIGFILGPVVLSLFISLLDIYRHQK